MVFLPKMNANFIYGLVFVCKPIELHWIKVFFTKESHKYFFHKLGQDFGCMWLYRLYCHCNHVVFPVNNCAQSNCKIRQSIILVCPAIHHNSGCCYILQQLHNWRFHKTVDVCQHSTWQCCCCRNWKVTILLNEIIKSWLIIQIKW